MQPEMINPKFPICHDAFADTGPSHLGMVCLFDPVGAVTAGGE